MWFFKKKTFKLGLALGSGGAKGFAHLGALQAFRDNGVAFDVVTGTSIGSIIGAFYAEGFSATDISGLVSSITLKDLLTGVPYNMDMAGIYRALDRMIGGKKIEELKKPFAAVATDADTMAEVPFFKGSVAAALCGSSCFLPYFKPFKGEDGKRYIDGAYQNSVPADHARTLGADYVVGIDLAAFAEQTEPVKEGAAANPKKQGYLYSNVMLTPDLTGFKATAINRKSEMYERGYEAAMEKMDEILRDIAALKKGKKLRPPKDADGRQGLKVEKEER